MDDWEVIVLVKELDVVRLRDGHTATVLEVFGAGDAYLVEIADKKGRTLSELTVKACDIEEVVWKARPPMLPEGNHH